MHCNAEAILQIALGSPSPGAAEPVAKHLPERPGQPVCTYYMRTGTCFYGPSCRYHHPPQRRPVRSADQPTSRSLRSPSRASLQARAKPTPLNTRKDRASQTVSRGQSVCASQAAAESAVRHAVEVQPVAATTTLHVGRAWLSSMAGGPHTTVRRLLAQYYMKTGQCKYGPTCRFNHPQEHGLRAAQAPLNPSGLPLRPELCRRSIEVKGSDEKDCSFYLRTGQCKYGVTCKFNHPQAPIHDGPGSSVTFALTPGSPSAGPAPPSGWPILRPTYLPLPQLQSPGAFSGPTLVLPTGPHGVMQMHPAWNYQSHVLHMPFVRS
eukprot:SM001259S26267  [mRNA]  locus=s1259:292:2035:+ [translate_table: standard]